MTQQSYPWAGTALTDAGPYTFGQWNSAWGAMLRASVDFGDSNNYNIGVFYQLGNHLEPSISGTDIDVDTGGCLVDGLYHENDTTVSLDIGSPAARPAANPRIDYIVVRKNYSTITTYTPANSTATVPPQTARITIIRGAEAGSPVAPALVQDTTRTTYWDIPLATVQVSTGGVLSNFTDKREYVDAETKKIMIAPMSAWNNTDSKAAQILVNGVNMSNNKIVDVVGAFSVPVDYISDMKISSVIRPDLPSGNVYVGTTIKWDACGQAPGGTGFYNVAGAVAVTGNTNECSIQQYTLAPQPATEDIVSIFFSRDPNNVLDTLLNSAYFVGFLVEYFGWKK